MPFDIAPYRLPNMPANEIRFEEPRDIVRLVVSFAARAPEKVSVSYTRHKWPDVKLEEMRDLQSPAGFGWAHSDDWFNGKWHQAVINIERIDDQALAITFRGLSAEIEKQQSYDVTFRRALALRVDEVDPAAIGKMQVFTRSAQATTKLRAETGAGGKTPGKSIRLIGHNAVVSPQSADVSSGAFELDVAHMTPAHRYSGDDGLITLGFDDGDAVTISLTRLASDGPIWCAHAGLYIRREDDATTFDAYRAGNSNERSVAARVLDRAEQSLAGATNGQPNAHPVSYVMACKLHPQRFRIEFNGDVILERWPVVQPPVKPNERFRNEGAARFFFGLERWTSLGRFTDAPPASAYNHHARLGAVTLEQKSVVVPLNKPVDAQLSHEDTAVALLRFRFTNTGPAAAKAQLPIGYSSDSGRSVIHIGSGQDDWLVPRSAREKLGLTDGRIVGQWKNQQVLRAMFETSMDSTIENGGVYLHQLLQPGESCEALVKIPYVAIDRPDELAALAKLQFAGAVEEAAKFWSAQTARGAQIETPEPQLSELHRAHVMHVEMTDLLMADSDLINTSVGSSTYGNFSNEACMIIHDLHERGLFDDARRRLELWIKYQSSVPQPGNFTDYNGMYFGAGGFESGAYNQHHGWVVWCLAEHYFFTRDRAWLEKNSASLIAGCDWVFRQRKNTQADLPHSRGWERGFLPAGSLEDVTDFYYWLSTNSLTWRGVDLAAAAFEAIRHPESARLRKEADAYGADLRRGFDSNRRHSPLVRLRDGRWVPHYPSRLYCRGRDIGWIRETLEGAVYLLISGLYPPDGKESAWILNDYQDNRYTRAPFGYVISDFEQDFFDRGGLSIQPNLLAGLMPHLDRDEPEIFLWMFFNCWAACYREQIGAMVEHPFPDLGFSNCAHFKTSDQANAVSWLRQMFVHATRDKLHLGQAVPRAWLADGQNIAATDVCTRFGRASVRYASRAASGEIIATVDLDLHEQPARTLLRFRHPDKGAIKSIAVNEKPSRAFDAKSGDVDLTGASSRVIVHAKF